MPGPTKSLVFCAALACAGGFLSLPWLGWRLVKGETRRRFPDVACIDTLRLAAQLDGAAASKPVLLDVREAAEFDVSHLAGARHVEPGSDPAALGLPKNASIVTYCSVGYRSAAYAQRLRQAGYTNVENLEGSIFQWANEGRPLVRDGRPTDKVHPYNGTWGLLLKPTRRADVPPADR